MNINRLIKAVCIAAIIFGWIYLLVEYFIIMAPVTILCIFVEGGYRYLGGYR